jgi:hypothetical protein
MASWDYQAEVTADSPYLWYRLNETSGTTATDDGSGAQNGTYAGTAAERVQNNDPIIWGANPGPQGKCVLFNEDGGAVDDGRVELAGVSSLPSTDLAVEFWIEDPTSIGGRTGLSYVITGPVDEFVVRFTAASTIEIVVRGTITTVTLITASNNHADGKAHHIYVDWRNSDGRLRTFYDGVQHHEVSGIQTGNTLASGGTLMLAQAQTAPGTPGAASAAYQGRMDQVAIYSAPLADARIQAHASAGIIRYASINEIDVPRPEFFTTGGGVLTYVNRVYDNQANAHVIWKTMGAPDITLGQSYPGPGTFDPTEGGNDTESHVVQAILEG